MQDKLQLALIFSFAVFLRCCIMYHTYSGEGKPPMYGDYEAQRHWQEITLNLPSDQWYINTTENNLQYWGLDYPPLTAYHSFLLGYIANKINPSFVKLQESKGFETIQHKYFMRLTVLIADILIYVPAIMYFLVTLHKCNRCLCNHTQTNIFKFHKSNTILLTALIYPGLILIDHGHFQYNCVSLGFFIIAVAAIMQNSFILGSMLFVIALNYKQMELYHALPFFLYILGYHMPHKTKSWVSSAFILAYISSTVLLTFFVIWLPFFKNIELFLNTVVRLFPLGRGIFEDKVANIWCAINIICKLRQMFTNAQLAKICLVTTICAILPTCVNLFLSPTKDAFIVSLINSALAFFLFSFQVHEKSVLLIAIPVLMYFHNDPFPCFWLLIISHFSMLPLFIKDNLYFAYIGTTLFYVCSVSWIWSDILYNNITYENSLSNKAKNAKSKNRNEQLNKNQFSICLSKRDKKSWLIIMFYVSFLGILLLSIMIKYVKPPEKYPDLFSLLVSIYSCGHFLIFFVYFNYIQLFTLKKGISLSEVKSL